MVHIFGDVHINHCFRLCLTFYFRSCFICKHAFFICILFLTSSEPLSFGMIPCLNLPYRIKDGSEALGNLRTFFLEYRMGPLFQIEHIPRKIA